MKFSTGTAYGVLMTTPVVSRKVIVTYATEAEATEEAAKAQERVHADGYTNIKYEVEKVGA